MTYQNYQRPWILKFTCRVLLKRYKKDIGRVLNPFEKVFKSLSPKDQILFILKERHSISISEIAIALQTTEHAIKLRRTQALDFLETSLWPPL